MTSSSSTSWVALQPGVGLGLLYNTPPSLSIPCSISPFVYSHLSQVRGHVTQPFHFWSSSLSCCIQLSVHLFSNCGVLHSFYMTKPSYSLAFNEPDKDNLLKDKYTFMNISRSGLHISDKFADKIKIHLNSKNAFFFKSCCL